MSRLGRLLHSPVLVAVALVGALAGGVALAVADAGAAPAQDGSDGPLLELGSELYATQCSNCHGVSGGGVEGRGPTLRTEGTAATDFVLRTGRMPLASPEMQAQAGPVRYSEEEILALVAFVDTLGDGPAIPDVDPASGDVARGGELYRLNCAACHVASGAGAPIGGGRQAPNLLDSTPTEVGEAILIGPGAMPVFGALDADDIDSIAAYIETLDEENTAGTSSFGGAGPVAEGLAAWLLALVPLIALTRWIGRPKAGRDRPVVEELDPLDEAVADRRTEPSADVAPVRSEGSS